MDERKKKILLVIGLISVIIIGGGFATYFVLYTLAEDAVFDLPVADLDDVTGIQVYHDNRSTQLHIGFDFKLENDTEIFAPIGGTITQVNKHQMSNNLWIIDVSIQFNIKWSMFIAFEPCTYDESVIDAQMENITVNVGDTVTKNQSLGILNPVAGSEFPHIHWTILEGGQDRSPYDHCSTTARAGIEWLCEKYGKNPED